MYRGERKRERSGLEIIWEVSDLYVEARKTKIIHHMIFLQGNLSDKYEFIALFFLSF